MQKDFLEILAIQDFSRKLILANALARKVFKNEYADSIIPYSNLLDKNGNEWKCSRTTTVIRTMADVDEATQDLTSNQANSIRLLVMAAGYDFIQAAPEQSK